MMRKRDGALEAPVGALPYMERPGNVVAVVALFTADKERRPVDYHFAIVAFDPGQLNPHDDVAAVIEQVAGDQSPTWRAGAFCSGIGRLVLPGKAGERVAGTGEQLAPPIGKMLPGARQLPADLLAESLQ